MKKEIEQNLITRACNGDSEAFSKIYIVLKGSIYGFAYRMTNQVSISEEITQEVFMFFIKNPDKYKSECGSLFLFLCGVARNKILNHLKKSGTRLEINDFETGQLENLTSGKGNSPLKTLLNKEFSEKLEECVARLSPFQREVLLLREMEELSYEEIAKITETDVGVIKSRLHRARRSLANELAPYLNGENEVKIYEVH